MITKIIVTKKELSETEKEKLLKILFKAYQTYQQETNQQQTKEGSHKRDEGVVERSTGLCGEMERSSDKQS